MLKRVSALGQGQACGPAAQRWSRGLGLDSRPHPGPAQAPWAVGRARVSNAISARCPAPPRQLGHAQAARLCAPRAGRPGRGRHPRRAALARHGVQALHCARCDLTLGRARSAQPRHCDTAAAFLDSVVARMPFAVRAIQVDGGSEFHAAFEAECQRRGLRLFVLPPRSPKLNWRGRARPAHAYRGVLPTASLQQLHGRGSQP